MLFNFLPQKQAELILNQETNSEEFEELFPILCETDQNNIQTGTSTMYILFLTHVL